MIPKRWWNISEIRSHLPNSLQYQNPTKSTHEDFITCCQTGSTSIEALSLDIIRMVVFYKFHAAGRDLRTSILCTTSSMQCSTARQLRQCAFNNTLHSDLRQSERGQATALSRAPVARSNLLVMHRWMHSSRVQESPSVKSTCSMSAQGKGGNGRGEWKKVYGSLKDCQAAIICTTLPLDSCSCKYSVQFSNDSD